MTLELNFPIAGDGLNATQAVQHGFDDFQSLAEHVRQLPYGRPADTQTISAVLSEQQGTCSFKHRLLAAVAWECGRPEVELLVGIYEMSEDNTPGVGAILEAANLISIPEAHCYLRFRGHRYDFTGLPGGNSSPFDSLLAEHAVSPYSLPQEKTALHHKAMHAWAALHGRTFAQAWKIREACIEALVRIFHP